jgi:hypothetical protein
VIPLKRSGDGWRRYRPEELLRAVEEALRGYEESVKNLRAHRRRLKRQIARAA